ncbi:MAG TPA: CPBP family intramembrane glutamic endopeptidase [Frankiaceae bacterium]|nr:CPBP family intramembrane glutamic endopeptidase [Frankiaceae bacterium]
MTFGVLGFLPSTVLVAYLALVLPVVGRTRYRALQRGAPEQPELRLLAYRSSITRQWLMVGVALAVLVAAGVPLADLGLTPSTRLLPQLLPGLVLLVALGAGLALLLRFWGPARRRVLAPVAALLPVTAEERRMFVAVAVTAGIAEEVLFRGFLLLYLTEIVPLPLGLAMLLAAVLFGLAHSYQGLVGILLTGLAGYWLSGLYVLTGSLLLPVLVHALVDLRLLLVLPRQARS